MRSNESGDGSLTHNDGGSYTTDINSIKAQEHILDPGGTIIASKRFDGIYSNMYFFYNYDLRGSVTSILNPDGTRVKGYDYDEFGNTKEVGQPAFKNDVKFTGAVHDISSGLYYMNARYYNPTTGRFLTQDTYGGNPYEPWTQHPYMYAGNNPVNMIDPTGHRPVFASEEEEREYNQYVYKQMNILHGVQRIMVLVKVLGRAL